MEACLMIPITIVLSIQPSWKKFPSLGFKSGFDWGEALYNAIVSERGNDYNLSLSEKTVQTGKEQAKLISIRLRTLLSLMYIDCIIKA